MHDTWLMTGFFLCSRIIKSLSIGKDRAEFEISAPLDVDSDRCAEDLGREGVNGFSSDINLSDKSVLDLRA